MFPARFHQRCIIVCVILYVSSLDGANNCSWNNVVAYTSPMPLFQHSNHYPTLPHNPKHGPDVNGGWKVSVHYRQNFQIRWAYCRFFSSPVFICVCLWPPNVLHHCKLLDKAYQANVCSHSGGKSRLHDQMGSKTTLEMQYLVWRHRLRSLHNPINERSFY
jgi:hypothetical protein